jgi:hypothetical protein
LRLHVWFTTRSLALSTGPGVCWGINSFAVSFFLSALSGPLTDTVLSQNPVMRIILYGYGDHPCRRYKKDNDNKISFPNRNLTSLAQQRSDPTLAVATSRITTTRYHSQIATSLPQRSSEATQPYQVTFHPTAGAQATYCRIPPSHQQHHQSDLMA